MITISFPEHGGRFVLENGDGTPHRFFSTDEVAKKILRDFPEEAADITHGWLDNVTFINIDEDNKNDIISMVRQGFQMANFDDTTENCD